MKRQDSDPTVCWDDWKEMIIHEVLSRLEKTYNPKPSLLCLVDEVSAGEMEEFRRNHGQHYRLSICKEENGRLIWDGKEPWDEKATMDEKETWDEIIILGLSFRSFADIALGLRHTVFTDLVTQLLLKGCQLKVASGESLPATCPQAYRKLIQRYVAALNSYGITFLAGYSPLTPETAAAGLQAASSFAEQKLVTARDIATLPSHATLAIGKGTIITALARDEAKVKGIKILEMELK